MTANTMCISCLLSKQEKIISDYLDANRKAKYVEQVQEILDNYGSSESAPALAERINQLYRSFWGEEEDYTEIKHKYNQLLLSKESEIWSRIIDAKDCIKECIKYVSAGNYIDFSAVENVNEQTLDTLLDRAKKESVPEDEYVHFRNDLEQASRLVYLTDNCGEIVLDKLFIKCLQKCYPELQIIVVVRGEAVINDATLEDAKEVGLTDMVTCIGNGNAAPGTVLKRVSSEVEQLLKRADVIISKGQGNFESLFGEGLNPYYIFLCKCELFVHRFGLQKYESVFVREERTKTMISG